ncbi:hypothetical protein F4861DRAFT_384757 [Xylaria intraflava]|nr:hypothetical protein F4861DRAFT_384757 [Xylaria intraflava]
MGGDTRSYPGPARPDPSPYPRERNLGGHPRGHLQLCTMKSTLLPSQRAVLAMSRAQYRAHARREGEASAAVDKVSVGLCVFRLDGRTLRPAVLLLRRSPRWRRQQQQQHKPTSGAAGDWELPGGKVADGDFCISAAIERLVRETTGLRVTRIMEMLPELRWTVEGKGLRWDVNPDKEGVGGDDDGVNHDDDNNIRPNKVLTKTGDYRKPAGRRDNRRGAGHREDAARFGLVDFDALGTHGLADSGTRSLAQLARELRSITPSPPPPPPKDDVGYGYGYGYHELVRNYYDDDEEGYHDPSLEPAPLVLPVRSSQRPTPYISVPGNGEERVPVRPLPAPPFVPPRPPSLQPPPRNPQRCRGALASAALPGPGPGRESRGGLLDGRRKAHVQLNFTVLVDEDPAEEPVPGFLLGGKLRGGEECGDGGWDGSGYGNENGNGNGNGNDGEDVVYEHDALEWATWARVEVLPMSEDLRRVVLLGLEWMGRLTGGFF